MKWMMFKDIPRYIYSKMGIVVQRRVVDYWISKGRLPRGIRRHSEAETIKLKYKQSRPGGVRLTCSEWIDDFMRDTN